MTPELRARLGAILDDPDRVVDVPRDQVGSLIGTIVHLLGHLAGRLQGQVGDESGPAPDRRVRPDRLLTPGETSAILGVSRRWLYRHADKLPFTRRLSRKCLRFSESGVYKYLGRAP